MIEQYLHSVENFIVVGDRVLIKQRDIEMHTQGGLVLPSTVKEKEEIQSGYVIKSGPGYPIPSNELDESWKEDTPKTRYIGMQAQEGDLAIFLKNQAHEIEFEKEKYLIINHNAILLLIRDEMNG